MMEKDELELMDGRTIVGYPRDKVEQRNMEFFQLVNADKHCNTGSKTSAIIKEERQKAQGRLQKLFLANAFKLLECRERILGDSRMFLTQVPVESGLAYVGSDGFADPTLGVYIEWWVNCPYSSVVDKDGCKWLIYRLAGSPLSERNKCGLVDRDGNVKDMELLTFRRAWESFISINRRYKEGKQKYYGFSLLQTMAILEKEGKAVVNDKDDFLFSQERKVQSLTTECDRLKQANAELTTKYHHTMMRLKAPALKAYLQELDQVEKKLFDILNYSNDELRQMRECNGNTAEYQQKRSRIRKEKIAAMRERNRFMHGTLFDILEGEPIGLHEVERFFGGENGESKETE